MVHPRSRSQGHARMHIGACSSDTNRHAVLARLLLDGSSTLDTAKADNKNARAARLCCHLRHVATVTLALHPCQKTAVFLACTRPPDFAASLFFCSLHHTQFLLDHQCDSCLRFLAGRCVAAHGFRATCIRRVESSRGLLATSFGGLQHFQGPHILYGRPSSQFCITFLSVFVIFMFNVLAHSLIFGSVQHLCASYKGY
jgi:hypothetical protein